MHALRSWTVWWLALFGLWNLLQGAAEAMELAAGAGAAALGATLAEFARREGLLAFAPRAAWLAKVWREPTRLLYEFGVVTWALVLDVLRVRRVRSEWSAIPLRPAGPPAAAAGDRAAALVLENVTPNVMAVDVDTHDGYALKHDLVPDRGSTVLPS